MSWLSFFFLKREAQKEDYKLIACIDNPLFTGQKRLSVERGWRRVNQ